MVRCPICQRGLHAARSYPHAPICSEACRREALKRAGLPVPEEAPAAAENGGGQASFDQLRATHLYCATCRRSMPTKERLLLMLPTGNLYGYTCESCGSDVGTKTDTAANS